MPTPKKRFKPRKVKKRVVVSRRVQLIKKGQKKAKNDTIPTKTYIPDNSVSFKVKIKRK